MERQINFPRFSFAFAFVMIMLDKHKPQQQATLTTEKSNPRDSLSLSLSESKREKTLIWGIFLFYLAIVSGRMVGCTPRGSCNNALLRRVFSTRRFLNKGLSGPVLHDTARLSQRYPPIARHGVFGVSTWPIGCDTPSPFSERFPLGEHAKWRCDTAPSKGVSQRYLCDTL